MIVFIILFFIGLLIVIKSANFLVDGASKIAFLLGVSPFFIGLTIVAFGTSSPELVVSIVSTLKGSTSLAFGNVIGSNIFNIAVILALSAIISPLGWWRMLEFFMRIFKSVYPTPNSITFLLLNMFISLMTSFR